MLHERVDASEWRALAVAGIGILVLYAGGLGNHAARDFAGISIGVLSGFLYASLILIYSIIGRKRIPVQIANTWRYLISIILALPLLPFAHVDSMSFVDVGALVGFGVMFGVIATSVHTLGMSRARPLHASIIGKAEPVFAVVYALIFLGEVPSISTVVGGVLILGSSIWLARKHTQSLTSSNAAEERH